MLINLNYQLKEKIISQKFQMQLFVKKLLNPNVIGIIIWKEGSVQLGKFNVTGSRSLELKITT